MNVENGVGEMLIFICDNKNQGRAAQISDKIFETCEKYGIEEVVKNLKDRNNTPLIMWTIDLLEDFLPKK